MIINIKAAELSDLVQIKDLMESVFGPFGKLEELFTKWITQPQYSVFVAQTDNKIIGVSTWSLKTDNDYTKYESFGPQSIDFMKNKKSAWVVNLAIYPEYRKNGIGTKLALAQFDWLEETNCEIVIGSSWVNGSEDNSQHLYLKAGFKILGESSEFLRTQLQNGAMCSICKTTECNCNSILFGIEAEKLIQFMANMKA